MLAGYWSPATSNSCCCFTHSAKVWKAFPSVDVSMVCAITRVMLQAVS